MLFTISLEDKNKRLDKFLVTKMPEFSRSQIQKLIKEGRVLVNDKKPSVHRFLKEEDRVSFRPSPDAASGRVEESLHLAIRDPSTSPDATSGFARDDNTNKLSPEIIFEDDNILVINKPPGLLVHPRAPELKDQEPTVVDWLIKKYPEIKKVGDAPDWRPGIVHRLDKETSGVMAIAKTDEAFVHLKKQFHDHQVKKEYLALIYGNLKADYGKIELPIGRAEKGGRMAARAPGQAGLPAGKAGKEALTEFEVVERKKNATLVKVFPLTGRTHQIRVHFFALGHPIVGDPLYQSKKYKPISSERMMLHAYKISFTGLDGYQQTFKSSLPSIFKIQNPNV